MFGLQLWTACSLLWSLKWVMKSCSFIVPLRNDMKLNLNLQYMTHSVRQIYFQCDAYEDFSTLIFLPWTWNLCPTLNDINWAKNCTATMPSCVGRAESLCFTLLLLPLPTPLASHNYLSCATLLSLPHDHFLPFNVNGKCAIWGQQATKGERNLIYIFAKQSHIWKPRA